jgi:hypothetical protein
MAMSRSREGGCWELSASKYTVAHEKEQRTAGSKIGSTYTIMQAVFVQAPGFNKATYLRSHGIWHRDIAF